MASALEKTVSVTEFKATCLELMEAGADHRLGRVNVTKRGKPYVTLAITPMPERPAWDPESIFGCMKDSVFLNPGLDLDTPAYSDAELDGFVRSTVDQLDELARRPRD